MAIEGEKIFYAEKRITPEMAESNMYLIHNFTKRDPRRKASSFGLILWIQLHPYHLASMSSGDLI